MRAPATTAMMLFQRFFMRQSFSSHDRHVYAAAALFLACKVEEQHRRTKHFVDASHGIAHAAEAPLESARDEASSEWRKRRDALLEAERVLLQTLEFDFAVEQPAVVITASLRRWRDAGAFGSRFERVPELAALDRAAAAVAFLCMGTDLPLLFTTREVGIGCLWLAYAGAPVAVTNRLKLSESAFTALMDPRLLVAFGERAQAALATLSEAAGATHGASPLALAFAGPSAPESFTAAVVRMLSANAAPGPGAPLIPRSSPTASSGSGGSLAVGSSGGGSGGSGGSGDVASFSATVSAMLISPSGGGSGAMLLSPSAGAGGATAGAGAAAGAATGFNASAFGAGGPRFGSVLASPPGTGLGMGIGIGAAERLSHAPAAAPGDGVDDASFGATGGAAGAAAASLSAMAEDGR